MKKIVRVEKTEIRKTAQDVKSKTTVVDKNNIYIPSTKKGYTIQLMALEKGPLKDLDFFTKRGVKNVQEIKCVDGFTRYVFGEFDGYRSSLVIKKKLLNEGKFLDIWIRPIKDIEDLKQK